MSETIEISKDILEKTTWCTKGFSCLTSNPEDTTNGYLICKIEQSISEGVKFVECKEPPCSYALSFGDSYTCKCPTRNEIYNKYRI